MGFLINMSYFPQITGLIKYALLFEYLITHLPIIYFVPETLNDCARCVHCAAGLLIHLKMSKALFPPGNTYRGQGGPEVPVCKQHHTALFEDGFHGNKKDSAASHANKVIQQGGLTHSHREQQQVQPCKSTKSCSRLGNGRDLGVSLSCEGRK